MAYGSLTVRHFAFQDGERFCVLLGESGLPFWYPNLYITNRFRNRSLATMTMESCLFAIKSLLIWCDSQSVDLEARFGSRNFLSIAEMDSLRQFTQLRTLRRESGSKNEYGNISSRNIEKLFTPLRKKSESIGSEAHAVRLSYIANYLEWLAKRLINDNENKVDLITSKEISFMRECLNELKPVVRSRNTENGKLGLSDVQRDELLSIASLDNTSNPFINEGVKLRNYLIVVILYFLGIRQGECLNIKVKDLDFQNNTLLIARRADEVNDPRRKQPNAKTNDRRLPLSSHIIQLLYKYITDVRRSVPGAKKHDYLFVSHKLGWFSGRLLSQSSMQKIFDKIKKTSQTLPKNFSPHLLRHNANDRFSEVADEMGLNEHDENKRRSYMFGWKETSGTSAHYRKRHTKRQAKEVAIKLQEKLEKNEPEQ
jgi:integrase